MDELKNKGKKSKIEVTTLNTVPREERKSWIDVSLIQAGVYICVPSLLLGGLLASGMSMTNAIIAGTLGYLVSVVITAIIGIIGADVGVPTCVLTMSSFGRQGARIIISLIFAIAMIGWFSVQNSVCGAAFSSLLSKVGINIPDVVSVVIWGIIMLVTAVYGIDGLKILNQISVPALAVIISLGCYMAINEFGTDALSAPVEQTMTILDGVVLTASFLSVGMTCASDFTRYQRSRGGVWTSSFLGIMVPGVVLLVMGAVLTKLTGENDLSIILSNIGLPILGMVILILATWTTNTTNAYSAGIDFVMLFKLKDDKRAITTMVAGVIGTVLAAVGFSNYFESFVNSLGILFMPVAGVMAADYWIYRKGKANKWSYSEGFSWSGIIAWIAGGVTTYFISHGSGLFIGAAVSVIVYLVLKKLAPGKEENTIADSILGK
ncbi:MAG: cytosine permease [Anaerovoracaceae bacterium]